MDTPVPSESLGQLYRRLWEMHNWLLKHVLPELPEDSPLRRRIEALDNRLEEAAMAFGYLKELAQRLGGLDAGDEAYLDHYEEILEEIGRVKGNLDTEIIAILDAMARAMFELMRRSPAALPGGFRRPMPPAGG